MATPPVAKIDVAMCERLINAATAHCTSAAPVVQTAPQVVKEPNWEGVTTGLTALSADFALALLILALITLVIGLGWGTFVLWWAERAAKKEAREAAKKWMDENAAALVREYLDLLSPVTQPQPNQGGGGGGTAGTADEIAESA